MLGERVGEDEDIGRERIIFALTCGGDLTVIQRVPFPASWAETFHTLRLGIPIVVLKRVGTDAKQRVSRHERDHPGCMSHPGNT